MSYALFARQLAATVVLVGIALGFAPHAHAAQFHRQHDGSCQLTQRVKVGAPHREYNAMLIALRQCGKPIGKPLNLLAIASEKK